MIFEHFAVNVPNPKEMVAWYQKNLQMECHKSMDQPPYMHFLADESGRLVMEIYSNDAAEIPDYNNQHPLTFHIAFATDNAEQMRNHLIHQGVSVVEEQNPEEGTQLIMMRDPFGIPLQICQRAKSFATDKEKLQQYLDSLK